MLRCLAIIITLGVFLTVVSLGVNLSVARFNQTVLPPEPIKPFYIKEQSDRLQIALVGEIIEVNKKAIENKLVTYLEIGRQQWTAVKDNPYLNQRVASIFSHARQKWDLWLNSDQVKAVNGWIKEQLDSYQSDSHKS